MGVKRTIQMPGMGILTMPGYAFHFTVSQGLNLAESCNMFLEVMGWTFEKLWKVRGFTLLLLFHPVGIQRTLRVTHTHTHSLHEHTHTHSNATHTGAPPRAVPQ